MIDDTALGDYQIVRPLGRGGMGLVFLGHDPVLDRPVAIKLIATAAPSAAARERFLIEARAIARLAHPNVVAVYRAGETRDGRPFLVQELVRGKSLDRLIPPLAPAEVRRIGVEIARGLAAAHRRGVLHRDLKPANVMIADDGTVKILDFGLAKLRPLDQRGPASAGAGAEVDVAAAGVSGPAAEVTPATRDGHRGRAGDTIDAVAVTADAAPAPAPALDDTAAGPLGPRALAAAAPIAPIADLSLTQPGAIMGTPRYMAPEQWRGEAATERSDLYALGAVLFELASGRPVYLTRDLDELRAAVLDRDPPALATVAPEVDAALAAVVDRALARDPAARPASADALAQALATAVAGAAVAHVDNPYRGLAAFAAADRALFFGRGADVGAIVDRLRGEQAVIVVGDSGVGKSSLVRAGVLPAIAAGGLGGDRAWGTATLRPGTDPLAAALAALGGGDELAAALAAATSAGRGLVVFVDQAEELITQAPRARAAEFAELLVTALARDPGLRVIASVRGDFVTRLADVPGLAALVTRGLHLVSPLDDAGRREAIVGPAAVAGVELEPAAIDALVAGSAGRGGLPLLQFALTLLWQRRDVAARRITVADVAAIGGVAGALARHADGVIAALDPDGRATARRLLTALVTADGTSAVRDAAELALDRPGAAAVLDALIDGRLVVARDGGAGASYALAHDALIVHWAALAEWLADDVGARARRQRLTAATAEWARLGRGKDGLLTRRQLTEAAELIDLAPREQALIAASGRALARRRTLSFALAALALAAIVAAVVGTRWANQRARDREVARHVARAETLARTATSDAARMHALRSAAFADFDVVMASNDAASEKRAETTWAEARAAHASAVAHYRDATVALEPALLLDSRAPLRRRMAELLLAQADLAAVAHDREAVAELTARIATYDPGLVPDFDPTATVTIDVTPPAHVIVCCVVPGEPRRLGAPVLVADGLHHEVAVPTVSCTVTATAPGHVEVVDVVRLDPDERRVVRLALPPLAAQLPGFVYVPAGRFLYGTADAESVRKSRQAAPQHTVFQPAFWMARHETTFAEWLDYLDGLPAIERAEHRPVGTGPSATGVQLTKDDDGVWALEVSDGESAHLYHRGQRVPYPARTTGREQAWEQWPVVGVRIADARAYAAWLDRTGRVPGARLCTNAEWERAARGADDRTYPHGDALAPSDANWLLSYGQEPASHGPDEVGRHPASDSPFGIADLVGNVWEFVNGPPDIAVTRGGGWYSNDRSVRASNMFGNEVLFRDVATGVRLCADAR